MSFFHQIFRRIKTAAASSDISPTPPESRLGQFGAMDPKEILFSMPTLENTMPAFAPQPVGNQACQRMHEDDWRQFEFIDGRFRDELAREIGAIDKIWQKQAVPIGEGMTAFRETHVRTLIPRPLDISMDVSGFESLFGVVATPVALLFDDRALADVYAARLDNVFLYGAIQRNRLTTLGVEPSSSFALPDEAARRLGKLIVDHDLTLVHWRSRTVFESPQAAMKYLTGRD
jgi:hypothetical protein